MFDWLKRYFTRNKRADATEIDPALLQHEQQLHQERRYTDEHLERIRIRLEMQRRQEGRHG